MPGFITAVYAALCALLLLALSVNVIRLRFRHRVGIGDGGYKDLALAIRVQANFIEYVPLALILMYFNESMKYPSYAIHALGIALVIGRLAHAWGLSQDEMRTNGRSIGVVLTFAVVATGAIMALVGGLRGLAL